MHCWNKGWEGRRSDLAKNSPKQGLRGLAALSSWCIHPPAAEGCLLSPILFNIFLERIMSDALEKHDGKVSIGGRNITNLRFADDIDALAEEEQKVEALEESLDKTCTKYKIELGAEKTKLMTHSTLASRER